MRFGSRKGTVKTVDIIKWVVTPPCRSCIATPEFTRRLSCVGCEKLRREKTPAAFEKRGLSKTQRLIRNARVLALRDAGFSFGRIGLLLDMPRATVQSAEAAGRRESSA